MRFAQGGRRLERLAGTAGPGGRSPSRTPGRWRTVRGAGAEAWAPLELTADQEWLRGRGASLVRDALQQTLLFPTARFVAHPRVFGADDLLHAPQPAVLAANHASDLDTPLIIGALPYSWRSRTVVGAAADRFYRRRRYAMVTALWLNTFPFDRSGELRGLGASARFLHDGYNVLLFPQGTRSHGLGQFRAGVARLALAAGVPVVPVHVAHTALLMPKHRGLNRRGSTTVTFGRPIHPRGDDDTESLLERTTAAVLALAEDARRRER